MVDLTETFARHAVDCARKGDWVPLAEYLENSNLAITGEIRELLTQLVKGELKRPNHRITATTGLARRDVAIIQRFAELKENGASTKSAVLDIMKEFHVSERTVFNVRREYLAEWNKRSEA